MEEKKMMIVGIGGVGGYLAGMTGQKYSNLTLIARGKRGEALREHGVVLHSDYNGEMVTRAAAVLESASEAGAVQDLIFLCVKTYALEEVCSTLASCVDEHTIIVPVMNGADTAQRVREYLGKGLVVDSVIYTTAAANKDYSITQLGQYTKIILGASDPQEKEAAQEVFRVLRTAGIDCEVYEDVRQAVWEKYIFNCAYNVITAYYLETVENIRDHEDRRREFHTLLEEALAVAEAAGVHIREHYIDEEYMRFLGLNEGSTSSLKRDVEAGRPSEFETFGGYLIKTAKELGVPVPLSEQFYDGLKEKIKGKAD